MWMIWKFFAQNTVDALLAHELAHIRRHDYLVNLLQTAIEIMQFYHPGTWWISRVIRIEREQCCDDMAVGLCENKLTYAKALALASIEEIRHTTPDLALAANGGTLLARINRVLYRPRPSTHPRAWIPGMAAFVVVTSLVLPVALAVAGGLHDEPLDPDREGPAQRLRSQ